MDNKQGDIIQAVEQCLRRNGCSSCENCPYTHVGDGFECREKLRDDIIALLKAQQPRVHGRWITNDDCGELECPICGGIQIEHGMFCTWCGAKMSGGVQDDD